MKKNVLLLLILVISLVANAQYPPPPTGLTLTALSATSMHATWNASTGAAHYYVMLTDNATCPDFDDKANECVNYFDGPTSYPVALEHTFTGLTPGTNYWLIVAAVDADWGYSGVTKTTNPTPTDPVTAPAVTTSPANYLGGSNATLGGNVTDDGGDNVQRGVVYSTIDMSPTIAEGATQNSNGTGLGVFSETITTFAMGQTYYVRAYAQNSHSTVYGDMVQFSTNTPPTANNDSYFRFYTDNGNATMFSVPANGVLANDTDPETANNLLTVGNPRPNSVVNNGILNLYVNGSFDYTSANADTDYTDSFTYYVNDGTTNSTSYATVTINILTPRFTNSTGNGLFSDPNNWNCGYVPNEQSLDLIIASGVNLIIDTDYTCRDLKFELGSSFDCQSGHTLTITRDVLDRNDNARIELDEPMVISSGLEIKND